MISLSMTGYQAYTMGKRQILINFVEKNGQLYTKRIILDYSHHTPK